jgi:hypothetical protein
MTYIQSWIYNSGVVFSMLYFSSYYIGHFQCCWWDEHITYRRRIDTTLYLYQYLRHIMKFPVLQTKVVLLNLWMDVPDYHKLLYYSICPFQYAFPVNLFFIFVWCNAFMTTNINKVFFVRVSLVLTNWHGVDYRVIGVQSPAEAKDFSSSLCVQTFSEVHPAPYPVGTRVSFLGFGEGRVKLGWGMTLTSDRYLVLRSSE